MSKEIYLKDSQDKLMQGINLLADAVQSTLGPSGKTVIIKNLEEEPFSTKDGVTVAMSMNSSDPVMDVGIQMVKKVASKMDSDSGDGTTTATVICRGLIQLGMEARKEPFFDEHDFKSCIYGALENTLKIIRSKSQKIELEDIGKVALTSANSDYVIANLFQQAFINSGKDGYINIVESTTGKSFVDTIRGYVVQLGYMERSFANNPLTGFFEAVKSLVLVYDNEFVDKKEMIKLIQWNAKQTAQLPILIIAKDYSKEVMGIVEFNNMDRIGNKICLIKNPLRNEEYITLLDDIAQYTGAEISKSYDEYDTVLGTVNDLVVKQGYTVFGPNTGTQHELLQDYLFLLETAANEEKSPFYAEDMHKRVSRMRHGVTTFYVGGDSEIELKEKKHRVEDAYKACNAALKNNVVIGGGQSLALISRDYKLENKYEKVFYSAIVAPFLTILKNSLHNNEDTMEIYKNITWDKGYNAKTREFEDLQSSGVIDPVSVVCNALTNAVSIALTVLSTECLIVETQNQ
jgi:chaperonin GroEL